MEDISVIYLLQLVLKKLWIIVLAMIVFAAGALCYCQFFSTSVYTATASILVTNGAIVSSQYTTETTDKSLVSGTDITASLSLANTVVDILKTPDVYNDLSTQINKKYQYDELQQKATVVRRNSDTLFIDISFKSSDPDEAISLSNKFSQLSCEYIVEYIPYAKATIASTAMSSVKVSPKTAITTIMAGVIGAIVAFAMVLIVDSLNQSIRGEDEFAAKYDVPLLGSVPDFDNDEGVGAYYKKGRYESAK